MLPLIIEQTKITPRIVLDKDECLFSFTGLSLPEDGVTFYQPVIDWMQKYLESPKPNTVLTFELEYFNTASSRIVYELLCMLKEPLNKGFDVKVKWCYLEDDEDMLEMGKDYANLLKIPFIYSEL